MLQTKQKKYFPKIKSRLKLEFYGKNNEFSIQINQNQLRDLKDPFNSNVEVFVTFKHGLTVAIIVGTPKNLEYLMAKDLVKFYSPGLPWIIVKELTVETINEAIQGYMDDC